MRRSPFAAPAAAMLGIVVLLVLCAPESLATAAPGVLEAGVAGSQRLDDVMRNAAAPLRAMGLPAPRAVLVVAALAVALSALATWLAARRLGLDGPRARQAGLLLWLTPAALLAGTRVAPHALHLLAGSFAALLAVIVARERRWWATVCLLAVILLAQLGSALGALLPAIVVPFWFRSSAPGSERSLRALVPALVLLGGSAAGGLLLRAWLPWSEFPSLDEVGSYDLMTLGPLVLRDGLRAFLPVSVLLLAAVASSRCHRFALVLLGLAGLHLLVGCHQTSTLGGDGWFLLPLLPPLVLMLAQWLDRSLWRATGIVALVLACLHTYVRSDHGAARAFTAGAASAATAPFVLIPGPGEQEGYAIARFAPEQVFRLGPACAQPGADAAAAAIAPLAAAMRAGQRVLLADGAAQALVEPLYRAHHAGAPDLLRALQASFTWRDVRSGAFVGHELVPR